MDIHTGVVAPCIILLLIGLVSHAGAVPITIEYYYLEGCSDCDHIKPLITGIERDLGESVSLAYIDVRTPEGLESFRHYGFAEVPAVVVNGTVTISKEKITDENVRVAIGQPLSGTKPEIDRLAMDWDIPLAYSLGLFSGFSPCLMAILGFILVYVTGSGTGLRSSLLNSLVFGLGLIVAYIVMGCCVLLAGMSLGGFGPYLAIAAGLITILAGANLLGAVKFPISTDGYIQSAIRKHSATLAGLFILGMVFSIVKAPCAAPMIFVLLSKILVDGTVQNLPLLLIFGAGVLTPFIGVGIVGGYGSSSRIREYRFLVKRVNGIILIIFGIWLFLWG